MKRLLAGLVLALACLCSVPALAASSGQLLNARQQFLNGNGQPLASGTVYIYAANTLTPVSTYQDPGLTILNTSPIILDANGMASIWVPPGNYREQVYDASNTLLFDQTTSAPSISASSLSPGAAIGTSGDVTCTATTFTGASPITLPCTATSASTSTAGKVQLTTSAVAQAGTSSTQAVTPAAMASVVQGQTQTYVVDSGGSSNTVVASPTPAWSAYAAGEVLQVKLANAITGGSTLNVSGLGAKNIQINGSGTYYTIPAGQIITLIYDGTEFQTTWNAPLRTSVYVTACSSGGCTFGGGTNVSSVTRLGSGHYTVTFTTAYPNADYSAVCSVNYGGGTFAGWVCVEDQSSRSTSSVTLWIGNSSGTQENGDAGFNLVVTPN